MRLIVFRTLALGSIVALYAGCCSSAQCLDSRSGKDKLRVKARALSLGVVHNDSVSGPKRDRTDWKYVELSKPGKLAVELHWDSGKSKLELGVFDVLGVKIQSGRPWGAGGRRALVAVEEPGRYYVRVRAKTKRDKSHYSLRLVFKRDVTTSAVCHDCVVGERKCLGATNYVVCAKVSDNCTAWKNQFPCPASSPCRNGVCAGCTAECRAESRRCHKGGVQKCIPNNIGCLAWGSWKSCGSKRCRSGRCVRRGRAYVPPPKQPKQPKRKCTIKAKIISIYRYRGRMTLHLEIGNNPKVRPGMPGVVLSGGTGKPLPGGEIKITRVTGRFAIATTSLEKLGKNRWVAIKIC